MLTVSNLTLQQCTKSLKHSTIKLLAAVFGLIASSTLLIISFLNSENPKITDINILIPFIITIIPALYIFNHKSPTNYFKQEIREELKALLAKRKKLEEVKYAICDFFLELLDAEAVKLELKNSIHVTRPFEVDPAFNNTKSIRMTSPTIERFGKILKVKTGRISDGPLTGGYLTILNIDLIRDNPNGDIFISTQ